MTLPLKASERAEWQFNVQAHDVGFSASFASEDPESPLFPVTAPDRREGKNHGHFIAPRDGMLCLHFDNKFSWTRSKQIDYSITAASA